MSAEALRDRVGASVGAWRDLSAGASVSPGGGGIGLKVLADDLPPVKLALRTAWSTARRELWGIDAPPPRRY